MAWKRVPYPEPKWETSDRSIMVTTSHLFVPFKKNLKKQYRVLVNSHPPFAHRYVDKTFEKKTSAMRFARGYMRGNK